MLYHYLANCFWLMVPVLGMNLLLAGKLPRIYQPEVFSSGIPWWIVVGENGLRVGMFLLPMLMPLQLEHPRQHIGFVIYLFGLGTYFLSWALQIWRPRSAWSRSRWGFMAPAYTPFLWLMGIALIGDSLYLRISYTSWIYAGLAVAFLAFHNLHAWITYTRESFNAESRFTYSRA
jgi:hypothetical protein